jgi:hypothetical protein
MGREATSRAYFVMPGPGATPPPGATDHPAGRRRYVYSPSHRHTGRTSAAFALAAGGAGASAQEWTLPSAPPFDPIERLPLIKCTADPARRTRR